MIRPLLILFLSAVSLLAEQAAPLRQLVRMHVAVQKVELLTSHSGPVLPVDSIARFAVTARIESVSPTTGSLSKGATVTFAVHSPARIFRNGDPVGKTFEMTLTRIAGSGREAFQDWKTSEGASSDK